MNTIGLLGGMSWSSTIPYYRIINQVVSERLGGLHSARLVLYNAEFREIELLQRANAWNEIGHRLGAGAEALKSAGAGLVVLCSNTMHKMSEMIEDIAAVPLLHVVDATAEEIKRVGLTKIGLLGSRYTMEQEFYSGRLRDKHGLDVLILPEAERSYLHKIIYDELCYGRISDESRRKCRRIIQDLIDRGAQGVILGCTEISTFIGESGSSTPIFDAMAIHAHRAAEWVLDRKTFDRTPTNLSRGSRLYRDIHVE